MNKMELTLALKTEADISKDDAERIVNIFFNSMTQALTHNERVEIRGLCSFYIKKYKSYMGRNPKTGDAVFIKAKQLPFFKAGKELKDRVNK
ncbi:MAG TPA: integration host factor subunit beta [Desulfobacteraceae bacterium]|nr:integration host factor subunit beta [Desulfobacteraceae bacterium]